MRTHPAQRAVPQTHPAAIVAANIVDRYQISAQNLARSRPQPMSFPKCCAQRGLATRLDRPNPGGSHARDHNAIGDTALWVIALQSWQGLKRGSLFQRTATQGRIGNGLRQFPFGERRHHIRHLQRLQRIPTIRQGAIGVKQRCNPQDHRNNRRNKNSRPEDCPKAAASLATAIIWRPLISVLRLNSDNALA